MLFLEELLQVLALTLCSPRDVVVNILYSCSLYYHKRNKKSSTYQQVAKVWPLPDIRAALEISDKTRYNER